MEVSLKKVVSFIIIFLMVLLAGCSLRKKQENSMNQTENSNISGAAEDSSQQSTNAPVEGAVTFKIDPSIQYQVMESFGTSGCWWSQYVGGWEKEYRDTGIPVRDYIAMLLFDKEKGIGLTSYRYNLGAGSAESGNGTYWDNHRRAQSFETSPGVYDWSKDANAVWFLKKAVELGVPEIILFNNSPLERLTISGKAQVDKGKKENILPENYDDFAKYDMDVTEHFISEGIPVKFISPINEPQWDWFEGQEGCHYEPSKIAGVYRAFLEELQSRPALACVKTLLPAGFGLSAEII
jgi:O-glycosyl hydrolase